jgi:hypothetical protein
MKNEKADMKYPGAKKEDTEEKEYDSEGNEAEGGGLRKGEDGELSEIEKSERTPLDVLEKSMTMLEGFIDSEATGETRKETLLSQAQEGQLSKSENDELFNLLGGDESATDSALADDLIKSMQENETMQDAFEMSDFLREQNEELTKSLGDLAEHVDYSDRRQHDFNLILAKSVQATGNLVKSLTEQLDRVLGQPVRGPKSQSAQPLQKSFAGSNGSDETMTKSEVLQTLDALTEETMAKSGDTRLPNGTDLVMEIAKFEATGNMEATTLQLVEAKHRGASR